MNTTATLDEEQGVVLSYEESNTLSDSVGVARLSLHSTVKARKEAEKDVQLLMNRIKLLKTEEAKAIRNASIARMKANRISNVKRDAACREKERAEAENSKQILKAANHERTQYLRQVARISRENSRKQVEKSKLQQAIGTKTSLRKRIEEKLAGEQAERDLIQRRAEAIKQEREASRKRIETERIERLRSFHFQYERKMLEESRKKEETEALIERLEVEEMQIIHRLEKSQELHVAACVVTIPSSPGCNSSKSMASSRRSFPLSDRKDAAPCLAGSLRPKDVGGAALR